MEEKEPTLKDLAHAIAENSRSIAELRDIVGENTRAIADTNDLLRGFIGYAEGRFEKIDQRFDALHHELDEFKQETAENFRQVNREIADLRENTMPLAEQSELRLRVHRIEDHLGLPHEVKPA